MTIPCGQMRASGNGHRARHTLIIGPSPASEPLPHADDVVRPTTSGAPLRLRFPPELLVRVDAAADEETSRAATIRRLVEAGI